MNKKVKPFLSCNIYCLRKVLRWSLGDGPLSPFAEHMGLHISYEQPWKMLEQVNFSLTTLDVYLLFLV